MRLLATLGAQLAGHTLTRLRRLAIGFGFCGVCLIVALVELVIAAGKAIEIQFGPIAANLIVAGGFLMIALLAYLVARSSRRPRADMSNPLLAGLAAADSARSHGRDARRSVAAGLLARPLPRKR